MFTGILKLQVQMIIKVTAAPNRGTNAVMEPELHSEPRSFRVWNSKYIFVVGRCLLFLKFWDKSMTKILPKI